jgi:TPR repeat protein
MNNNNADTDETDESPNAGNTEKSSSASDGGEQKATKPESDGPLAKSAKASRKAEVATEEPAQPKILGEKDPLIVQADKYIQGRGVRKNCSTGINLLRQAVSEGNPAASVKLGALYWSGTCVTQSKVTAYQWFSRAHSLEPRNRWVERSRNSLWANMSPEEQRRVSF